MPHLKGQEPFFFYFYLTFDNHTVNFSDRRLPFKFKILKFNL